MSHKAPPAYREDIPRSGWMYHPEIRLIKYKIDFQVENWNVPIKRNNPFFYCYWNKTDGGEIHVGEKVYSLSPDRIVLIPPNLEHSPVQKQPFNHSYIHFIALPPFDSLNSVEQFPAEQYAHLFREYESDFKTSLALYSLIFELMLQIPHTHFCRPRISDERIIRACHCLSADSGKVPPLKKIAEKLNMSQSSLCHLFKEKTGVSPIHYAMERRLEKALLLLSEEQLSIEEIALKTGFSDRYHFSKAFKSRYGTTPVQTREALIQHSSRR